MRATQVRPGMTIRHEGELYTVHSVEHRTPGNKRAAMATKMRSLRTGSIIDYRFRAEEADIERAIFDEIEHRIFLLGQRRLSLHEFVESYEQFHLGLDVLGEAVYYLIPNTTVKLEFYEGKAIGVMLPDTMDFSVARYRSRLCRSATSERGKRRLRSFWRPDSRSARKAAAHAIYRRCTKSGSRYFEKAHTFSGSIRSCGSSRNDHPDISRHRWLKPWHINISGVTRADFPATRPTVRQTRVQRLRLRSGVGGSGRMCAPGPLDPEI